jgi:hypothetical protein
VNWNGIRQQLRRENAPENDDAGSSSSTPKLQLMLTLPPFATKCQNSHENVSDSWHFIIGSISISSSSILAAENNYDLLNNLCTRPLVKIGNSRYDGIFHHSSVEYQEVFQGQEYFFSCCSIFQHHDYREEEENTLLRGLYWHYCHLLLRPHVLLYYACTMSLPDAFSLVNSSYYIDMQ